MSLFHHKISFTHQDPLDDGLRDMITAEQQEAERITLADEDGAELAEFWTGVTKKLEKDPDWFDFTNE